MKREFLMIKYAAEAAEAVDKFSALVFYWLSQLRLKILIFVCKDIESEGSILRPLAQKGDC